jgi:hypothetical protein
VAIEKSPQGQRVLESHFPCSLQIDDITSVTKEQLAEIGAKFPNCKAVLFGGGPPCQGVSDLNASRLGAEADPKSSLHQIFDKLKGWIREIFIWCPCFFLMESVCSMGERDREVYTRSSGVLPYKVDASYLSLCRRPRFWWFNWEIQAGEGIWIPPQNRTLHLTGVKSVFILIAKPRNFFALAGSQLRKGSAILSPPHSHPRSLGISRQGCKQPQNGMWLPGKRTAYGFRPTGFNLPMGWFTPVKGGELWISMKKRLSWVFR